MGHCRRRRRRKKKKKKKHKKREKRFVTARRKRRKKNSKEFGRPGLDKHWGMCDKQCLHHKPRYVIQG